MKKNYLRIKNFLLALLLLAGTIVPANLSAQSYNTDSTIAIADVYVASDGTGDHKSLDMRVKPDSDGEGIVYHSYVKFDLTGMAKPDSVAIVTYGSQQSDNALGGVYDEYIVQALTSLSESWEENTITWENKPGLGTALATVNINSIESQYWSFSDDLLTDIFNSMLDAGASSFSVVFKSEQEGIQNDSRDHVWFGTLNWSDKRAAKLMLYYEMNPEMIDVKFSHPEGTYAQSFDVELYAEEGNFIFYTTDGSYPDITSSQYTDPITIESTTTIRALSGMNVDGEWKFGPLSEIQYAIGSLEPFNGTPFQIPGQFQAEEYDFGAPEVASHDEDFTVDRCFKNNGCGSDITGQCASNYRYPVSDTCDHNFWEEGRYGVTSDGHDGGCSTCDELGEAFCTVGYTSEGEWWRYTVNVQNTGLYNLKARYMAKVNNDGTRQPGVVVETLKDGKTTEVGEYRFPANFEWAGSGWPCQFYGESSVKIAEDLFLESGNQTIKIEILDNHPDTSYAFNVDYFELVEGAQLTSVSGLSLNETSVDLAKRETFQLTPTITPSDATVKGVKWSSSDNSIAHVDANGLVTAMGSGTATITASSVEGGQTATCEITVKSVGVEDVYYDMFAFKVYPTVISEEMQQLNVEFSVTKNSTFNIHLYDIYGKLVKEVQYNALRGSNHAIMNLDATMSSGMYLLRIQGEHSSIGKAAKIMVK